MDLWQAHRADLGGLAARDRLRRLIARTGRDFSSNDYLGMSGAPRLARAVEAAIARGVPMGSGGSRLLPLWKCLLRNSKKAKKSASFRSKTC